MDHVITGKRSLVGRVFNFFVYGLFDHFKLSRGCEVIETDKLLVSSFCLDDTQDAANKNHAASFAIEMKTSFAEVEENGQACGSFEGKQTATEKNDSFPHHNENAGFLTEDEVCLADCKHNDDMEADPFDFEALFSIEKGQLKSRECDTSHLTSMEEDAPAEPSKKYLIPVPLIEANQRDGPWKTIIMLGETGTGKSTTLNSIVNYLFGVRYEDNFRYVLIDDYHQDQSQSVTSKVTAYHIKPIHPEVPYGITLVDGPGFNDTNGVSRDEEIWKMYKDYFCEEMSELEAVCFTMRSTCGRFTPSQRYVYGKILALFGNDIEQNLFMLMTFCDGKKPPAMSAVRAANFPCEGRCIKLNNSAFFNGFEGLLDGGEEGNTDEDENENTLGGMDLSAAFWKIGNEALRVFFVEALPGAPKTSLALTREVLQDREQLEMIVVALNRRIREGLDTLESIRQTVRQVKKHQTNLDAHADFKITVSKPHVEKVDLKGRGIHTTTCLKCNYTCHERCGIARDECKANCWAMTDGQCRICPSKCHWSDHSNLPYWFKHSTRQVEEIALSKKASAEAAALGISNTEAILREQRDKYVEGKLCVMKDMLMVHRIINHLRLIALRKDLLDADDHFQAMVDSEIQAKQPGFRERVVAIQSVREEAKLLREVQDGQTSDRLESMDEALKKIDEDIKAVSEKYEESIRKVRQHGGKAKKWSWNLPW